MATFDWPASLVPQLMAPGIRKAGVQFRSPFNGTLQAIDFIAERWLMTLTLPPYRLVDAGTVEALLFRLTGGVDRARCWRFDRPSPRGTMRGAPTLSAGVVRGATTLPITGGTPSGTLLAGDMLGCGGQLFQVRDAVTLNGTGAGTVTMVNRVRATIGSGSAVVWDRPTAEFVAPALVGAVSLRPALIDGAAFDLEEVW